MLKSISSFFGGKEKPLMQRPSDSNRNEFPIVSVITPTYNSKDKIQRAIDSVVSQTMDASFIEHIVVDDCSSDGTQSYLHEVGKKLKNLRVICLEKNSGTPGLPRNTGIEASRGKYILFLDADDWLAVDGIEKLYSILEETGDDYVVGRTLEVSEKGEKIVGRHESFIERRSVSVDSISHIFQHLGPRARMLRKVIIEKNGIRFPEMKYSEDKSFFIDYLVCCEKISTTKSVIYYLNRLDDNNNSLTKRTDVFEKHDTNIFIIKKVSSKGLDENIEKLINVRMLEFDCMDRLFNRKRFLLSSNKKKYYKAFSETLDAMAYANYPLESLPRDPVNKLAIRLFKKNEFKKIENLYDWNVNEKIKKIVRKGGELFYVTPLSGEYQLLPVRFLPIYLNGYFDVDGNYHISFECFSNAKHQPESLIIKRRDGGEDEWCFFDVIRDEFFYSAVISRKFFLSSFKGRYDIRVVFNEYEICSIRREGTEAFEFEHLKSVPYVTINGNMALNFK